MLILDMNSKLLTRAKAAAIAAAFVAVSPASHAADVPGLFPDPNQPVSVQAREASQGSRPDEAGYRVWKWSLAPVIASQALDAASSWNMRELNPALADGSGRFAVRSATLKFSAAGALLCVEYLLVKKHPGAARVLAKLNWSSAVVTGAFAAHNYAIK
jgi:hypothetical protein